jgi:hypothetical protein
MMQEQLKAMLTGLRSLVVKLLDYYGAMLRLMWDALTMQEGVFKKISDLLKKMCNFARKMTLLALDLASSFLSALKRVLPFVSECPARLCMHTLCQPPLHALCMLSASSLHAPCHLLSTC